MNASKPHEPKGGVIRHEISKACTSCGNVIKQIPKWYPSTDNRGTWAIKCELCNRLIKIEL